MAEDITTPPASTPPEKKEPETRERSRSVTCEFCECVLDSSGSYKRLSDRARSLRDLEEKHEALKKEHAALVAKEEELERERVKKIEGNHGENVSEKKFFHLK